MRVGHVFYCDGSWRGCVVLAALTGAAKLQYASVYSTPERGMGIKKYWPKMPCNMCEMDICVSTNGIHIPAAIF